MGEADVLLFFRSGEFVPIEVKSSFAGVDDVQVHRLDDLAVTLHAPWCAIAVGQYGHNASASFVDLESRKDGDSPFRLILSYDVLLDPHPHWSMGSDPFQWDPLDTEKISERENKFVSDLAHRTGDGKYDWLTEEMLHRPTKRQR
jgi:hypothetical protein